MIVLFTIKKRIFFAFLGLFVIILSGISPITINHQNFIGADISNPKSVQTSTIPSNFAVEENKSVVNGKFESIKTRNEKLDEVGGFTVNLECDAFFTINNSQVATGSNSLRVYSQNYDEYGQLEYTYTDYIMPYSNIRYGATLRFNWYIESLEAGEIEQQCCEIIVFLNNSRTIRYFISGYQSNQTDSPAYNVTNHNMKGIWYFEERNLQQDYLNHFSSFSDNVGVIYVGVGIYQPKYFGAPMVCFTDNISLYIAGSPSNRLINGDFEIWNSNHDYADRWEKNSQDESSLLLKRSNLSPVNKNYINFTSCLYPLSSNYPLTSNGYLYTNFGWDFQQYNFISAMRPMSVSINYYIDSIPTVNVAWARYYYRFYNNSVFGEIYIYLFNNTNIPNNDSREVYFAVNQQQVGMWHQFKLSSLWELLDPMFPNEEVNLTECALEIYHQGGMEERLSVVIQDMGIQMSMFTESGFEDPSMSDSWLKGWFTWTNILTSRTSTTAAGGSYSANFTNPVAYNFVQVHQDGFGIMVTRKLRLSFDYNIYNFSTQDSDIITIQITFFDIYNNQFKYINYILNTINPDYIYMNGSISGYFVIGVNVEQKVWRNLFRNIYEDFMRLWPTSDNLNYMIYNIQVILNKGWPADTMTLLLDNLYFGYAIDIDAPEIAPLVISPSQPTSWDRISFGVNVTDSESSISSVTLYYSIDGGKTWNSRQMVNSGGSTYSTNIGKLPALTILSYYVVAVDEYGNEAQSNAHKPEDVILISTLFNIWEMFGLGMATLAAFILGTMIGYKIHKKKKAKRESNPLKSEQLDTKKEVPKPTPKKTTNNNSQSSSSQLKKKN